MTGPALDRRDALKALAAAVLATGCSRPAEEIVPYVNMPERVVPGKILRFATTVPMAGYGRGAVAITHESRPTKLEGNPHHPASLGRTDIFLEAAVLELYDPDRAQTVRTAATPVAGWDGFSQALDQARARWSAGADLRLLTGRVTSPTLIRQIARLSSQYPHVRWHRYEPVNDDNALAGSRLAFGTAFVPRPRLADAAVVWCVDADPLGPGPDQPRFAHDFARRRRPGGDFSRLYICESTWSLTGANADQRLALKPQELQDFVLAVASRCGVAVPAPTLGSDHARLAGRIAADLLAHRGSALVLMGESQPPELHALAHVLNARLAAPVDYLKPIDPMPDSHAQSLAALSRDLDAGKVDSLIVIGANPVYDSVLPFAIAKAKLSAHLSLHEDETGAACQWQLPLTHPLEDWSDIRAPDGTASVIQPLITPLYDTRDAHELVGMMLGDRRKPYDIVRKTWTAQAAGNFEDWWRGVLEQGVIAGSAPPPASPGTPRLPPIPRKRPARYTLVTRPDPSLYDGRAANNAWLQECPKPLTFEVWGNAFEISPADARTLKLEDGDGLRVSSRGVSVEGPVRIRQGQADGVIGATLGYGRRVVGAIGKDIGFRVAALVPGPVSVEAAGKSFAFYQAHRRGEIEGDADELYPTLPASEAQRRVQPPGEPPTMISHPVKGDGYAWAMVIDANLCIGCNACVIACQAENNIAVVGPEEAARGREMHWMRIDTYRVADGIGFQPVPCMQCEKAPCEPVCPVEASVHDSEGLNVQVYNRCIGTRFCEANCPYKVRHFNWFGYSNGQEYADLGARPMPAHYNPDVTVRARGVMEKCTYCVQRISRARRHAEEENRRIHPGEVVTACQAACPTNAIRFGNLDDKADAINALRQEPRHYTLLRELGTRPRTTYLAKLFNGVDGSQA